MSFLKALLAGYIWMVVMLFALSKTNVKISNDIQFLSMAIVVAGALASGDE